MRVSKFFMLVGIPASGKSTFASICPCPKTVILNSDNLRKELFGYENYQDKNVELFEEMERRAILALKQGLDVIYDATNLSSKRRRNLLFSLPKNTFKSCWYFPCNPTTSIARQKNRDRKVPIEVIEKMYRSLQVPMYHEGWDNIEYITFSEDNKSIDFPESYREYCKMLMRMGVGECINMPQDNPYHTLSVSKHMYYAYDYLKESDNIYVKIASLLHDIGKPYCKENNGRYSSFKGHDSVSAQKAIEILVNYGLSKEEVTHISTLIQLHMRLHNLEFGSKSCDKFRRIIGDELYSELVTLSNADSQAK